MSELNLAKMKAIKKVLIMRSRSVPFNKFWQEIYALDGIGNIKSKKLYFNAKDLNSLKNLALRYEGINLLNDSINNIDRIEAAAKVKNEKLSKQAPFASTILLASNSKQGLPLLNQSAILNHSFIGVQLNQIDINKIKNLIIIENGAAFVNWHQIILPIEITEQTFIYRSHGTAANEINQLLNLLPGTVNKIGYYDFDYAGLTIANSMNLSHLLVPKFALGDVNNYIDFIKKSNKKELVAIHRVKYKLAYKNYKPVIKQLCQKLLDNNWSFSQEALIAHNIPLSLIKI